MSNAQILEKNKNAIAASENYIAKIVGKELFKKHFVLDTLDSYSNRPMIFAGNDMKGAPLGQQDCFNAVYYIIQNKDTVGNISIYIGSDNKPPNEWHEPASSSRPELLLAYKKLLNNELKIDYQKAKVLGAKRGFAGPLLTALTDYSVKSLGNENFVRVKFFWVFLQTEKEKPRGYLKVNAETGKVEAEYFYQIIK